MSEEIKGDVLQSESDPMLGKISARIGWILLLLVLRELVGLAGWLLS